VAAVFGFASSTATTIACALGLLLLATVINFGGTKVLSAVAVFGFVAEIVGAVVVGAWLLIANRHHGLGVLFDGFGSQGSHSYFYAFAAASLIGVFQYYGFEACGDVAEEVPNPGRRIPTSMRRTIYIGGAAAMAVCLALILAVTDFGAVISGEDADPVTTVLTAAFGETGSRVVLLVVLISFVSCALSLQAAASRLAYSFGRDGMIFGSRALATFSSRRHVPPVALLVAGVVPALIIAVSAFSADALTKIISFSTLGIYLAFQMVVLAALRARTRGWEPSGSYRMGAWGMPVNVAALAYGLAAIVNICWPRTPDAPWYDNYLVLLSGALVVGVGAVYLVASRPHERSTGAYGDAIPARATTPDGA
jgi:amino acid transporter